MEELHCNALCRVKSLTLCRIGYKFGWAHGVSVRRLLVIIWEYGKDFCSAYFWASLVTALVPCV